GIAAQGFLDHVLVLLALQRARRVHRTSARGDLLQRSAQNAHLPRVKIAEVLRCEPPLDLWISRQRSRTGTRHVGEYAIETALQWKPQRIRGDDLDISSAHPLA